MSIFKNRPSQTPEQSLTLTKTTHLSYINNKDYRDIILSLYNSDLVTERALGSILNAVYTEGKSAFLLSVSKFETLIKNDKSLQAKSRLGIRNQKQARNAVNGLKRFFVEFPDSYQEFKSPKKYSSMGIFILDEQLMNCLVTDKQWCSKAIANSYELISNFFQQLDNTEETSVGQRVHIHNGCDDGGGIQLKTSPSHSLENLGKEDYESSEDTNKIIITLPEQSSKPVITPEQCITQWTRNNKENTGYAFEVKLIPELFELFKLHKIDIDDIREKDVRKLIRKNDPEWVTEKFELLWDECFNDLQHPAIASAPKKSVHKTKALSDDELNAVQFYKQSKLVTPERPFLFNQDKEIEPKAYLKGI